jgi:hypothetical protein
MVLHPLLLTQNRIEAFCVEIAIINLMPTRPKSRDDLAMQRRAEASDDWIGV